LQSPEKIQKLKIKMRNVEAPPKAEQIKNQKEKRKNFAF